MVIIILRSVGRERDIFELFCFSSEMMTFGNSQDESLMVVPHTYEFQILRSYILNSGQ